MRPALALALLLSACHPAPAEQRVLASCGAAPQLQARFAAELAQGRAPEASASGACVANAARGGSTPAALLLADSYGQAMVAGGSAALALDLFGRQVSWLRLAAEQGDPAAQGQLAQAMDSPPYRPMSDMALAWYQVAAEHGNHAALAAIADAYSKGRIADERLYDFRKFLEGQTHPAPAYYDAARLLARPAASRLPG